jgi:hypothetical protein
MAVRRLTLEIPALVYERLRRRAAEMHRSVETEAVEALVASVPVDDTLPAEIAAEMEALSTASDDVLWAEALGRWTPEQAERLEALHLKQESEPLCRAELEPERDLLRAYDRATLIRAHAMRLLKDRGHDIAPLLSGA